MPTGTLAQIASLRQKLRRDVSAFQNLIKKGPVESPFSLPANAKLFVQAQSTIVEVKEGFSLFVLAPWGLLPVPLQTEE